MRALAYQNGTVSAPTVALKAGLPQQAEVSGARGRADVRRHRLVAPVRAFTPLVVPVLLLATLLSAICLYADAVLLLVHAPGIVVQARPTIGDLILPMTWVCVHLTNRRLGAQPALLQLVGGMVLAMLFLAINPWNILHRPDITQMLPLRAWLAFVAAFFLANCAAIIVFDGMRGPGWWKAPFGASLAAALVFCALYYPAAFAGSGQAAWISSALVHFTLFLLESVLLLLPYWLLRPAMRPVGGLNGY